MFTIYKIVNSVDGKSYVGFTTKNPPSKRYSGHKWAAKKNPWSYLHRAMRKHGIDKFQFLILEQGEDHEYGLNTLEPKYIAELNPEYNISRGGGSPNLGVKFSAETRRRQRASHLGKPLSEEHRKNLSIAMKRNERVLEQNRKNHETRRGSHLSSNHRINLSIAAKNLPLLTCPHCSKAAKSNGMYRWHFDNCKKR